MTTHATRLAAMHEDVALRLLEARLNGPVWTAIHEAVDDVADAFPTVSRATLAHEAIKALSDPATANVRRAKLMQPPHCVVKLGARR